jgi:hypothetical protein
VKESAWRHRTTEKKAPEFQALVKGLERIVVALVLQEDESLAMLHSGLDFLLARRRHNRITGADLAGEAGTGLSASAFGAVVTLATTGYVSHQPTERTDQKKKESKSKPKQSISHVEIQPMVSPTMQTALSAKI